ncbi:hypothetical protein Btru_041683 [Bulinus truncatus]|nr:hypothetical protein Btru_041683 [Bulinus truncatus]
MRTTLEEFAANKSCPELFHFANSLTDLLQPSLVGSAASLQRPHSFPLLYDSEIGVGSDDSGSKTMTAAPDDAIEILSCHVEEQEEEEEGEELEYSVPRQSSSVPFKLAHGESLSDDRTISHRKRVVRAVGAVTFLLLLFSIILIGISLNMSKNIDEMVELANTGYCNERCYTSCR